MASSKDVEATVLVGSHFKKNEEFVRDFREFVAKFGETLKTKMVTQEEYSAALDRSKVPADSELRKASGAYFSGSKTIMLVDNSDVEVLFHEF